MSKRAEELWKRYARRGLTEIGKVDFLAALHEYGQEVRRRDAEVCVEVSDEIGADCAAAISKEPLP